MLIPRCSAGWRLISLRNDAAFIRVAVPEPCTRMRMGKNSISKNFPFRPCPPSQSGRPPRFHARPPESVAKLFRLLGRQACCVGLSDSHSTSPYGKFTKFALCEKSQISPDNNAGSTLLRWQCVNNTEYCIPVNTVYFLIGQPRSAKNNASDKDSATLHASDTNNTPDTAK